MIIYFSVMVYGVSIIWFMQLLKDVQTDVSYNLDHNTKVLLYPINGESNALSDRDMTCNDITDHLNPVTVMDEVGKEHPYMKYSFRDISVSMCMVLHTCRHVFIHSTEGRCVYVGCMCAVCILLSSSPNKRDVYM